ncbi:chlorophyll a/b-binding protein [Leptolyngbya sp. AN02str]|uniref:chlorophyll a/b-binding protein n=1 Tax=Leptolyngbya sp. AN02str TaxID=3423363 RepID=UPI003D318450
MAEVQDIQKNVQQEQEIRQPYAFAGTTWRWGFVPSAEIWNGRLAMIGFLVAVLIEVSTDQGFLHFWGLL